MSYSSGDGGGLSWRTAALAAVALVVIAAGITWTVAAQGDGQDSVSPAPTPTTSTSPTVSPPPEEGYESSCGLNGGSTQVPTVEPSDIEWVRLEGWAYPISDSAGPGKKPRNGPWSCFARTPMGAVIAAYTIDLRLVFVDDFEAAVRAQVVPGVGRDALLSQGQPEPPGSITDTKGFVVEAYSPNDAVVSLYVVQQGRSFTCSVEVQWSDGDWKLRAQSDGSTASGCIEAEPPRYVPWGDD